MKKDHLSAFGMAFGCTRVKQIERQKGSKKGDDSRQPLSKLFK